MSAEVEPLRALVLAAGRGERLRPLTDLSPKPLLPVVGKPIVEHTLLTLADAGVETTAINLHHLSEQIPTRLGDSVGAMSLVYSPEEVLLGTLGPLARLREVLSVSEPIVMVNGDSLCDWPVAEVLEAHRSARAGALSPRPEATLLLSSTADVTAFGGGVVADGEGRVLSFRGEDKPGASRRGVFAGLHAISSDLLDGVEERPSDIVRELYEPLLDRGGCIQAVFTARRWHDLGTPRRYLTGVLEVALDADESRGWQAGSARVDSSARITRAVLESDVEVGAAAVVGESLLMPESRVGREASVHRSIVGPGVVVDSGSTIEDLLLTRSNEAEVLATPLG